MQAFKFSLRAGVLEVLNKARLLAASLRKFKVAVWLVSIW